MKSTEKKIHKLTELNDSEAGLTSNVFCPEVHLLPASLSSHLMLTEAPAISLFTMLILPPSFPETSAGISLALSASVLQSNQVQWMGT